MKVMVISRCKVFPPIFGAARRIYNTVLCLSRSNKVILFSCIVGEDVQKTDLPVNLYSVNLPNFLLFFGPIVLLKIIMAIRREKPRLIISESLWAGLPTVPVRLLFGIRYIIDEHNVEYLRLKRLSYGKIWWPFVKSVERVVCKYADKVLCVSELDKQGLINIGVKREKIYVIPNGVDTEIFYPNENKNKETRKKIGIKSGEPIILFFGALDYEPNIEAIDVILNEIAPRVNGKISNAKFLIVGRNPPSRAWSSDNIIFTGVVNHIEDYINVSDMVICPLKSGGGTRLKILEAIACGKQVISTSIGAEGLFVKETRENLKISNGWNDFSSKIIDIIINPRKSVVPKNFVKKYSWERIFHRFENDIVARYL